LPADSTAGSSPSERIDLLRDSVFRGLSDMLDIQADSGVLILGGRGRRGIGQTGLCESGRGVAEAEHVLFSVA